MLNEGLRQEGIPGPALKRRRIDDLTIQPVVPPTTTASQESDGIYQASSCANSIWEWAPEDGNHAASLEGEDNALSEECCFGMVRGLTYLPFLRVRLLIHTP